MNALRVLAIGMAFLGIGFGCDSSPQSTSQSTPQSAAQIPALDPNAPRADQPIIRVAERDPSADSGKASPAIGEPDRLARQAAEHAKAIEALLAARDAENASSPGVPIFQPDVVQAVPPADPVKTAPDPAKPVEVAFAPEPKRSGDVEGDVASANPVTSPRANTPMRVAPETSADPAPTAAVRPPPMASNPTDPLESQLAKRAREYPRDLTSQLDYQLLLFTKDEQVPRMADIAGLATEDREILTATLDGLTNFRNNVRADNNMLMNRKVRPLIEMADRLRSRADLSIPNAMLCREVKGFGTYTPIENNRFEAGIAHKVIVYAEVENFASRLNDKNLWETQLEQHLVLYSESGLPLWEDKVPTSDVCRNRRRDFFIARIMTIPANVNMGRYTLKVSVTDQQANRIAETSIPIAIVAK